MNKYWWILLLWLPVAQAHYPAQVLKVVDGDTVKVMVEVWPDMFIKTSLRIRGIDTPEAGHKAKCLQELAKARLATEFTRKFVSGPVVVSDVGHGSFARRMVGSISVHGVDLATELIAEGLGRAYFAKKKRGSWCGE